MKSYVKPFIKQLTIAAIFLSCVTVISFGIRHIRFGLYRANPLESPVIADIEPDTEPANSQTADVQSEPEYTDASDGGIESESEPQQSTAPDSVKMKSSKSKSSKSLEKISLSDYENLYITKEGQLWYVNEEPDGKTVKMQVRIDDATGEITVISNENYAKSDNSKERETKD